MASYTPIACSDYDALEVACMHRYDVDVITDDQPVRGKAMGLEAQAGAEYLIVERDREAAVRIRLDNIRRLVVLSRPAHFEEHRFAAQ